MEKIWILIILILNTILSSRAENIRAGNCANLQDSSSCLNACQDHCQTKNKKLDKVNCLELESDFGGSSCDCYCK